MKFEFNILHLLNFLPCKNKAKIYLVQKWSFKAYQILFSSRNVVRKGIVCKNCKEKHCSENKKGYLHWKTSTNKCKILSIHTKYTRPFERISGSKNTCCNFESWIKTERNKTAHRREGSRSQKSVIKSEKYRTEELR